MADKEVRALGIDYSLPSLRKARARPGRVASWIAADVRYLPVRPGTFDGVICFGVTQALVESRRVLEQLMLAAKPGGEVWIDGLNSWCLANVLQRLRRKLRGKPRYLRYESPGGMRRLMEECGYQDIRLFWLPIMPNRLSKWQNLFENAAVERWTAALPLLGALVSHSFVLQGRRSQLGQT